MIIKSKVKDFYDYLQYQYGQDNTIVWERDVPEKYADKKDDKDCEEESETNKFTVICHSGKELVFGGHNYKSCFGSSYYKYRDIHSNVSHAMKPLYISILGEIFVVSNSHFLIYKDTISDCIISSKKEKPETKRIFRYFDYKTYIELEKLDRIMYHDKYRERVKSEDYFNEIMNDFRYENKNLLMNIHRKLKQPILTLFSWSHIGNYYSNEYSFTVRKKYLPLYSVPNLISVIGSAEKLYQNIYNFFIEVKDNVDLNPPVEISNKDKIVESGFDLKTSFRNPIRISQIEKKKRK